MNKKMQTIYALRAMPGSGKSTLISQNNLESNTISLDSFRELFSGMHIGLDGNVGIDQQYNDNVSYFFRRALAERLKERATIIIDNLNVNVSELNSYYNLAKENGYDFKVVNFKLEDLEFYKKRNLTRAERKQLPESSIERIYNNFSNADLSLCKGEVITVNDFEKEINTPNSELIVDLNKYENVYHIGDILGSKKPLIDILDDYNENDFFIFTGNYFDLGTEPDEVLDILNKLNKKENVVFIRGNFDNKLIFLINDLDVHDENFNRYTLDKLKNKKDKVSALWDSMKDFYFYEYNNKKVFVSNAGVSKVPNQPFLINASTYTFGVGSNVYDIDYTFSKNTNNDWLQIHGYRSFKSDRNPDVKIKSFSLESGVAIGGGITTAIFNKNGLVFKYYKNDRFNNEVRNKYLESNFQTTKEFKKIDLSSVDSVSKEKNLNIYKKGNTLIYGKNGAIFRIENISKDSDFYALVRSDETDSFYLSENKGNISIIDAESNFLDKDIPKSLVDIVSKFDCIAHCCIADGKFSVIDVYHKDENKNKLKTSLFEDFIKKNSLITFKNEKALKGFINSIKTGKNKSFKGDVIIEYKDGIEKIKLKRSKNKYKKGS